MKKALLLILTVAILAGVLSGCAAFLEDEYVSVQTHDASGSSGGTSTATIVENYGEIKDAVMNLVERHYTYGVLRTYGYSGDVKKDVNKACADISVDTAIGAYAVYYIDCSVNQIVSYYEVQITITYKKTADDVDSILDVSGDYTLKNALDNGMRKYLDTVTIRTDSAEITADYVTKMVKELYYDDPTRSVVMPQVTVTEYPEGKKERIMEISFSYEYIKSKLGSMAQELADVTRSVVGNISTSEDVTALREACGILSDLSSYEKKATSAMSGTAYGALVKGLATDEGFAMAYKLLCDELSIDCVVVHGRLNSEDHVWNMVTLDGVTYHVDPSRYKELVDAVFLKTDEEMSSEYWWETEELPASTYPVS